MRHAIVKLFALYRRFEVFGHTVVVLRVARYIALSLLLFAIMQATGHKIASYPFLAIFIILIYISFDWGGLGYFAMFPVKFWECDDFQKFSWARYNWRDLQPDEIEEYNRICDIHPEWLDD